MQRRRDEVDVLRDVFRERIRTLERDALVAVLIVAVDVVLRLEDVLRLRDSHIEMQRATIRAETDLLGMDAAVLNEPVVYGVDGLLGRAEDLCDPRGCPELSVARGLGVRDFEEVLIELVEVGLRQGYLQRNDDVRVSATLERPAHGGKRAGLVNNAFRKDRRVGCRSDGDNSSGELDEDPRQQHHKSSDRPRKLQAKKAGRPVGRQERAECAGNSPMCIAVLYIVLATLEARARAASWLPTAVRFCCADHREDMRSKSNCQADEAAAAVPTSGH